MLFSLHQVGPENPANAYNSLINPPNSTAMTLRRPNLVRWNRFMDECVEVLESSDAALPTDRLLCQQARLQHINEEIGQQFLMDDPAAAVTILDHRVPCAIKTFENQLRDWKCTAQKKYWNGKLFRLQTVSPCRTLTLSNILQPICATMSMSRAFTCTK